MSVEIIYHPWDRFGNHLFRYVFARLFAEDNGLFLRTPFPSTGILSATDSPQGACYLKPEIVFNSVDPKDDPDLLNSHWPPGRYIFNGWFQRESFYHPRRDRIRKFLITKDLPREDSVDIVAHVRLKDYKGFPWAIHPSWYIRILEKESFRKLYLVTDEPDSIYFSHFKRFNPIIVSSTIEHDWNFIRSFDRILCSNSTFSWWACFLSEASKIYTFKKWIGVPGISLSNFPNGISVEGDFWNPSLDSMAI